MYNNILDFVESKIDGFERPEIIIGEEFTYGVESRDISVPENYMGTLEQRNWWKKFMMKYLMLEHGLFLTEKDDYTFSLLHEIGHYITLEDVPSNVIYSSYDKDMMKVQRAESYYEYEKAYREITIEKMADLWAIAFIEAYPEVLEINSLNIQ
jgi:hypothetical protein